jgi:hypothetical protein
MNASEKKLLNTFDLLSEIKKRELASEIIRRTTNLDLPPLNDEELVHNANELFLALDRREADKG